MSNPVLNKIIYDMYYYTKLFDEGCIPLDTLDWRKVYFCYMPDDGPVPNEFYHLVGKTAKENFETYHFRVKFDEIEHPHALGPNRIWLYYKKLNV